MRRWASRRAPAPLGRTPGPGLARALASVLALVACQAPPVPAREADSEVPAGYALVYAQDFEDPGAADEWWFSDPRAWRTGAVDLHTAPFVGPRTWLRADQPADGAQFDYTPPVRSPHRLALLREPAVGDFVLEVDALSTGRRYGHRDLCVVFGFEDPGRFYYAHLAPAPDDHAGNVFTVADAPRRRLAEVPARGTEWEDGTWYRLRVERRLADGLVRVSRDGEVLFELADFGHGVGHVGVGTFDDSGGFTRLRLWAPEVHPARFASDPFAPGRAGGGDWPAVRPAGAVDGGSR